ncbi:hypothetical protein [Geoglobus acetivorans]
MNTEEFLAAITAIHRYIEDHSEKPVEIRREVSYWKIVSRVPGW